METDLAYDYAARLLAFLVAREGAEIDGSYHRGLRLTLSEVVEEMVDALERVKSDASEGQVWRVMHIRLDKLRATLHMRRQ